MEEGEGRREDMEGAGKGGSVCSKTTLGESLDTCSYCVSSCSDRKMILISLAVQ